MADYSMEDLKKYLETGVGFARTAGKEIQSAFFKKKQTEIKSSAGDPVTETDKLIEKLFVTTIKEAYPTHSFIGEESTAAGKQNTLTDNPTWIVDPVDGTCNFVHCLPYVCVSIALAIKKQTVVGIVYNPMHDEMYTAVKGDGSFCNGNKINVSGQEDIGRSLIYAAATKTNCDSKLANMKACLKAGAGLRYFGCAAEGLCLVANSSLDAYFDYGLHAWDVAAGALLVQEAGGVLMEPDDSFSLRRKSRKYHKISDSEIIDEAISHGSLCRQRNHKTDCNSKTAKPIELKTLEFFILDNNLSIKCEK